MQILLPFLYTLLFILLIYKMNFFVVEDVSRFTLAGVFVLKIIAGTTVWWFYTYYYPEGDLQSYFRDGNTLFHLLFNNTSHFFEIIFQADWSGELETWSDNYDPTLYNDSRVLVILNMVFRFFSFGFFHVHTVFMCFLSLLGITGIYKTFSIYFQGKTKLLFVSIFLLPSVLFWSSAVLKEGLVFFAMGILLYITNCGFATTYNFKKILLLFFSIFILLFLKLYILIALIPGLLANYLIGKSSPRFVSLKYIFSLIVFLSVITLVSFLKPQYNALTTIVNKQKISEAVAKGGVFLLSDKKFVRIEFKQKDEILIPLEKNKFKIKLNSSYDEWEIKNLKDTLHVVNSTDTSIFKLMYVVQPPNKTIAPLTIQPTISSILKNAPKAFYNTLTIPLEFNTKNWLIFFASLENVFYLFCILVMIICFKLPDTNTHVLLFCFSFFLIVFLLAGLTTPIAGALVRYRTPALPFMMIFIFMLTDKNKLKKIPFLGRYLID